MRHSGLFSAFQIFYNHSVLGRFVRSHDEAIPRAGFSGLPHKTFKARLTAIHLAPQAGGAQGQTAGQAGYGDDVVDGDYKEV